MNETAMPAEEEQSGSELDIRDIFHVLLTKIFWIAGAVILCAAIAFAYTKFFMVPYYETSASLYVRNKEASTSSDITVANYLAADCKEMIFSRETLDAVIADLGLPLSAAQLSGKISVETPTNTRFVNVTVQDADAERAVLIADKVCEIAAAKMTGILENASVITVGNAYRPLSPSGPSLMKNVAVAGLAGLVAACLVIVVIYVIADKIKDADDVEKALGISTLAVIPHQKQIIHR